MSSELLLEIRTDPMPPREVEAGTHRLKNALVRALRANGVAPKQSATGFTARRLLVLFRGMSLQSGGSPSSVEPNQVERVAESVRSTVENLVWPKTMTWEQGFEWISPVRGVLLLLDGERLPIEIFGHETTDWTLGPESTGSQRIGVTSADDYGRALAELGVEIRYPERRRRLQEALESGARSAGGELLQDGDLLKARAVACETAAVISVPIDPKFQALPRELIQECLRDRLAAFCVIGKEAEVVAAVFVIDRWDDPDEAVARSYEWAIRTYLDDVSFFLERDRRLPLAERCREQESQVLSSELGTYGERADRCLALCDLLCDELNWQSERDRAREAIGLLAADGRTELLRAFPGLEGVIGGLLAREEGYPASVWQAIADSRRAAVDSRSLPRGRVGKLVALADRFDRLATLFRDFTSVEEPAAGLAGVLAARRELVDQIVRIGMAGGMALDLRVVGASALRRRNRGTAETGNASPSQSLLGQLDSLNQCIDDALERVFKEAGFDQREIASVVRADGSSLLADQKQRLEGLRSLRGDPRLAAIAQTAKRIAGILQGSAEQKLDVALLTEGCERDLYFVYRRLVDQLVAARNEGSYAAWQQSMTDLTAYSARFLREVLVRDENEHLRQNRLALLQRINWLYAGEIRLAELLEEGD